MTITPELYEFVTKVVEDKVREIKVTREEFDRLTNVVRQLAEAQRRTEERLNQLAQRVDQLAQRVDQLAEAQRRTEEVVARLAKAVDSLRHEVGKLSEVVGFGLEDIARVVLPGWLHRNLGVEVEELERRFLILRGEEVEVNLYGEGYRNGSRVVVVGECKSRIHRRDVDKFYSEIYRPLVEESRKEVLGVLFGYLIHPSAQERARSLGLYVVASYQR